MQHNTFSSPWGDIHLSRRYGRQNARGESSLRAWDAADEYLLQHCDDHALNLKRVLVVNDGFGALSCALLANPQCEQVLNWSDSFISHRIAGLNLQHNALNDSKRFQTVASTEQPVGHVDLVLIKLPKTLALLEDQLIRMAAVLADDTPIIAAGMVKHWQASCQSLFEKIIGRSHTSLARKKARLLFCQPDGRQHSSAESPYPSRYQCRETGLTLLEHANVFCRGKLDIGTRFFLQQFEQLPEAQQIVDLGCGNGILGIMAKQKQPESDVYFVDESYMAVSSAKENYRLNIGVSEELNQRFIASDCLQQAKDRINHADLVLCNPPFHQQQTVGDHIAWQMFQQSRQILTVGGRIQIVGNRHMNYHSKLGKLFGNCRTIAANKKFVVLEAVKQPDSNKRRH